MERLGNYWLQKRLGCGGMAEVWKATGVGPGGFSRTVAVKRPLPEYAGDADFLRLFVDEARLSARLNHPNIVWTFELAESDGVPFIVMEYVDGQTLLDVQCELARTGDFVPFGQAAFVGAETARALAYAHAVADDSGRPLGIIHRDVSPSNVMLGADGSVRLLDFGIAKAALALDREQTQTGIIMGKLA
jgi:serine/threonine-protein kinase